MRIRIPLLALVLLSALSSSLSSVLSTAAWAQDHAFNQAQMEVVMVFDYQGRALEDQDMDLWGQVTMPTVNLEGTDVDQYDLYMSMTSEAREDPGMVSRAFDPVRIQDVFIMEDQASLFYQDADGKVTQYGYVLQNGSWKLSEVW